MSKYRSPDFRYDFSCDDYSYETEYHHEEYGCNEPGRYCRCKKLLYPRVENVDIARIRDKIYFEVGEVHLVVSTWDKYIIDRLIGILSIYDPSQWDVQVTGGYYGEEIRAIRLIDCAWSDLLDKYENLHSKSYAAIIESLLCLEYGYILDDAKDCRWAIRNVPKSDIWIGQEDHYRKRLDQDTVASYRDYNLPVGVAIKDGAKYRLIDGYHRVAASEGNVDVIVGLPKQKE